MPIFYEYKEAQSGATFVLSDDWRTDAHKIQAQARLVKILWNRSAQPLNIEVDSNSWSLLPHQICTLTTYHHSNIHQVEGQLCVFAFNRDFYCMLDHDREVSCYGILFYGAQELPILSIPESEILAFEALYQVFCDEFQTRDNIQGEMLRMLLKRLVIKCTRLAKMQTPIKDLNPNQTELVRQFNYLVDFHYKTKKSLAEYAELMNKSPKTISNLFTLYHQKTPLEVIHDRIVLEAKRLLRFSDKSIKEIAFELGFEDPAHFNKLFKKMESCTPMAYREKNNL